MNGLGDWTSTVNTISAAATTAATIYTQVKPTNTGGGNSPTVIQKYVDAPVADPNKSSNMTTYLIVGGLGLAAVITGVVLYNKKKKKAA